MRNRKRNKITLGSGLLAALLALIPALTSTGTPAVAAPPTVEYVALGDSYAVGLGLGPSVGTVPGCGQTAQSYPRQVALNLGFTLTDMTCSGATTDNVINSAQPTSDGTNPVQTSGLTTDTDLVTLTIGGNDLGFSSIIQRCVAQSPTGPLLFDATSSNCVTGFTPDGGDTLADRITGAISPALAATLNKIKELSPSAHIVLVGYPALMPDAAATPIGGCFTDFGPTTAFPFTNTDVAYLHSVQAKLDNAMASAASAAGISFVRPFTSTLANTPCANNPAAGINGVSLAVEAMHPNASGSSMLASQVQATIEDELVAPSISPASSSLTFRLGALVNQSFSVQGSPTPTVDRTGTLPPGLSFDDATGTLSGTPTQAGTFSFSLTATNTLGTQQADYTVTVAIPPAIISAAPAASATVGSPYTHSVTAIGYPAPELSVNGALPPGLSFDPNTGIISGTPTAAGTSSFTIRASNSADWVVSDPYSITVSPAYEAPEFTSPPEAPAATVGSPYSFTITASGSPTPVLSLTGGTLPDGLAFNAATGLISGTPTAPGTSTFTITATNALGEPNPRSLLRDASGSAATVTLSITVSPANEAPAITSGAPAPATEGKAYSFTATASGYPAPTFAITDGTLPGGLRLNETTGVISGTPTVVGDSVFTLTASNGIDPASSAEYRLSVAEENTPPVPPVTPPADSSEAPTTPAQDSPEAAQSSGATTLTATGAGSLLPGVIGAVALLAGAGLLLVRRTLRR